MARDYEDLHDVDGLADEEIKGLIRQELEEYDQIDVDYLDIQVQDGAVTLSGRVGSEQEYQQLEQIVDDLIGVERLTNEVVIDDNVRFQAPEAADEAAALARDEQPALGKRSDVTEDSAAHTVENVTAELYGTQDVQQAIQEGYSYEPPDKPVQTGNLSLEDH